MDVLQAIKSRRAFRALKPATASPELIEDLARCAQLAPSCFNNQPWNFVFVLEPQRLVEMKEALSEGNRWAYDASMIIAVFSKKEDDCIIRDRIYHQFDSGLAVGFLILRATELGLVAHPIAGFSPKKTREILRIPEEFNIITLIIVGQKSGELSPSLSEKQVESEKMRPRRKKLDEFVYINRYGSSPSTP
ncbi:MAG: nitroreductase family protein [Candidatus Aminicenantes bacterium]|nr:nitroreductase family protein [Candidatus Aminicenantes bacterium]